MVLIGFEDVSWGVEMLVESLLASKGPISPRTCILERGQPLRETRDIGGLIHCKPKLTEA